MGVEIFEDYPYTPLDQSTPSIRLLRIQPDGHGSITGWLEAYSLDDPNCPTFTTLSYVWGPKKYSHKILVNGHLFSVLSSLYPILEIIANDKNLRHSWWWIDSICINQKIEPIAEVERNRQVAMMRKIYEKSDRTIGWLGQGHKEGEDGMRFLHVLSRHKERLDTLLKNRLVEEKGLKEEELGEELNDRTQWAALERLMLRPWWTRVWTLQEYIVPRKFVFHCGTENMDRDDLNKAMTAISLCRKIDETLIANKAFEAAWIRRRVLNLYQAGVPIQLTGLMAYISDYKASDPRDRIYSVLGLAADRSLADPPRYEDHLEKVYSSLVRSFITHHKSLDIICLADRFHGYVGGSPILPALPSWVPDWRAHVKPWVVPVMASQSGNQHIGNLRPVSLLSSDHDVFAAGQSERPLQVSFSTDLRTLTCQGVLIDLVDGIGGLKVVHRDEHGKGDGPAEIFERIDSTAIQKAPELDPDTASAYIDDIARCLFLDRQDRYLSHDLSSSFSYQEFQTFCLTAIETPSAVHPQFLDWFERNRSLSIRSYSLEEICKTAKPLESSTKVDLMDMMTNERAFLSRFRDTTDWMMRRLMTTNKGHVGMVPCRARKGDQVWVLLGCSIPLILRKWENKNGFQVIGECYLHGYMNGEVQEEIKSGKLNVEEIHLA
ncbi:HET-domain-containing protein [Hyaloscypha variabilis F]|uniref:HET-domain-containing protein n=1 Tax=Hyaloscypha variabilis (strain UAMH 11265 / GT02V1 / F) TaxID=1149755 RepID=A0A2J6S577_HYAVF|nr:HET-domain-containing protein [Hyaloscypha variabilis F]